MELCIDISNPYAGAERERESPTIVVDQDQIAGAVVFADEMISFVVDEVLRGAAGRFAHTLRYAGYTGGGWEEAIGTVVGAVLGWERLLHIHASSLSSTLLTHAPSIVKCLQFALLLDHGANTFQRSPRVIPPKNLRTIF